MHCLGLHAIVLFRPYTVKKNEYTCICDTIFTTKYKNADDVLHHVRVCVYICLIMVDIYDINTHTCRYSTSYNWHVTVALKL